MLTELTNHECQYILGHIQSETVHTQGTQDKM
jgi:hypothetical protein